MAKANTLTGRKSWQLRDWIASQPEAAGRTNGTLAVQASSACGFNVTPRNIKTAMADVGIVRPKRERKAAPVPSDELRQLREDIRKMALALVALSESANMMGSARAMNDILNR